MQNDRLRSLLTFFIALSALSLALNGVFAWRLYRSPLRSWVARWWTVPPERPGDHVRGKPGSPATIIVYSDFLCPYCRKLHKRLKTLAEGEDFRWVYRHFPLPSHRGARRAAEASECAARQGRFWELADSLSETPLEGDTVDELVRRAEAVGVSGAPFRTCLDSDEAASAVVAQEKEGRGLWISATPTFYVNGRRVVGAAEEEELRRLLHR